MGKKMLHFMTALVIVLSLVLAGATSAWAKTPETGPVTLEYADIEAKVIKDNKQLQVLQRTMPILTDAKKEIEKAKNEAKKAASSGSGGGFGLPDPNATTNETALLSMMAGMMSSMSSMSSSAYNTGDLDDQIENLTVQTAQAGAGLVNGAQQLFFTYYSLQDAMADLRAKRALLEENLALAKTQLNAGLGTPLAVKEVELSIAELDSGLAQMAIQGDNLLNNLKQLVGCPQERELILGAIPAPEREFLDGVDVSADIATARENSYSLRLEQLNYKHTTATRQKSLIKINIDAITEQVALTVITQYNKMLEANNTLLLEEQRLSVAAEKIKQARLQNQLGLLSEIMLQSEETSYKAQQDAVTSAMNSLFWEVENYKAIVAGLN